MVIGRRSAVDTLFRELAPLTATDTPDANAHHTLRRELGVFGATMLGLGSIVGTGVFVSVGIAAGIAGPAVIAAIAIAAIVALCNALSSAQLAAAHPVSGGTYEYAGRLLHPAAGFTAGWMFLAAKSASAATAALGFAGYLLHALGLGETIPLVPLALVAILALTIVVLLGIRRSSLTNTVIVSMTLLTLGAFVLAGVAPATRGGTEHLTPFLDPAPGRAPFAALLHASALMFVAYTGYGRIATLGEEVHHPRRTIPRAIILTLVVSAALYMVVGAVAIAAFGARPLADATEGDAAPLEIAAESFGVPGVSRLVALGAITAMLGVLLNLILGLSRVLLAMGRRRDMPASVARVTGADHTTPYVAVIVVAVLIAGLACIGSVRTTWTFSAFTVLVYYALTNASALRLSREHRLSPRIIPIAGLAGCLGLAFFVEPPIWIAGLGLIATGLLWHGCTRLARIR